MSVSMGDASALAAACGRPAAARNPLSAQAHRTAPMTRGRDLLGDVKFRAGTRNVKFFYISRETCHAGFVCLSRILALHPEPLGRRRCTQFDCNQRGKTCDIKN